MRKEEKDIKGGKQRISMAYATDRNFQTYLSLDLSKYAGKWIAVLDNKVVASGGQFKEVFDKAKKVYPGKRPLFDRVSDNTYLFLYNISKTEMVSL